MQIRYVIMNTTLTHVVTHRWRKGIDNLTPDDAIPIGKNVLMLKNIRETGVYTCTASSKLGMKEVNTTVKVQCKFVY